MISLTEHEIGALSRLVGHSRTGTVRVRVETDRSGAGWLRVDVDEPLPDYADAVYLSPRGEIRPVGGVDVAKKAMP